jgi:predicted short-subunit dehydrogenase-like oxidoreductase (DUF2520 family)
MENSLAIVGAGRVGRALGRCLRELGWKIGAVITRSEASARRAVRFIGAGKPHAGMTRQILASHVILIATRDDAIALVAQELARIGAEELRGKVILHTSGALDSRVLEPVKACGAAVGSMHPLQSLAVSQSHRWKAEFLQWRAGRKRCARHDRGPGRLVDHPYPSRVSERFCITRQPRWLRGMC